MIHSYFPLIQCFNGMKTKIQTITLALLGLIFLPNVSFGQLYEVSLDEKIEQSTLIVEGKVVESQCYRADNGDIYTANKVELVSILKGDYRERFLTITTWGGEMDGELQTWTHLLTLDKGDYGIFFLESTRVPAIPNGAIPESFDVYSGVQGFLAFVQNDSRAWVAYEPFHTYSDIPGEIFEVVDRMTGQSRVENEGVESVVRSGIRYHFTNIGFDGTSVTFDVYVNSLIGTKKLYKSGIQLGYNPVFFGPSIATNGNLSLEDAGISLSNTYDLTQSNVTSSKVKIEMVPVGLLTTLTTIDATEQLLAKGKITIQNILADPGITYDVAEMQAMSKFYEGGLSQVFDTVIVEGDWRPSDTEPYIDSIVNKIVAGGIEDKIIIYGENFGSFVSGASTVKFTSGVRGPTPLEYVIPMPNTMNWSSNKIIVDVPSVARVDSSGSSFSRRVYAGSGPIIVCNSSNECSFPTSLDIITVKYSAYNDRTTSSQNPSSFPIPISLRNANSMGGLNIRYGNGFSTNPNAKASFERALNTWRCNTRVNFVFNDSLPNTDGSTATISFGPMPAGVSATAKAIAPDTIRQCSTSVAIIKSFQRKFDIIFRNTIDWYFGEDETGIMPGMTDLQSTALHELGHAHLLNHVNQSDDIMFWATAGSQIKRELKEYDIEGGNKIMMVSSLVYSGSNCNAAMLPFDTILVDCAGFNAVYEYYSFTDYAILYPNPVAQENGVIIESISDEGIDEIRAFDILGKQLFEYVNNENLNKIYLDLEGVPSGLILVTIRIKNKLLAHKLIKL